MNAPLSRYLTCFSTPDLVETVGIELVEIKSDATWGAADLEARLEEARRATRADADREHVAAVAALGAAHEDALAAARATLCATEGRGIAALIDAAFARLHDTLAESFAAVLRPLLAEVVAERTVAALVEALDRLLAAPKHPVVVLRGPADLIEAVRAARPSHDGLALVVEDGIEAFCTVDGTHVETRLAATLASLAATEA